MSSYPDPLPNCGRFYLIGVVDVHKVYVCGKKSESYLRGLSQIIFPTVSVIMTLRGGVGSLKA